MALPLLEAMQPSRANGKVDVPRRMVAIETNMGTRPQFFFPEKMGKGYALSPYLERFASFRDQFTVFSGVSHPGVTAPTPPRSAPSREPAPGARRVPQLGIGRSVRGRADRELHRYPSLVLGVGHEGQTLSYTRSGAPIPIERSPRKLFERLFVQSKPSEVAAKVGELRQGRS